MRKERRNIPTALLLQNDGQIDWLPKNPRKWTDDDIEKTRKSIEEDPDFLEDRPLLVLNYEERFLVFAGNLRSLSGRNRETMPSVIYFPETDEDRETIKRRAMKDNGKFGSWDYDKLEEWKNFPLEEWGCPIWGGAKIDINHLFEKEKKNQTPSREEIVIIIPASSIEKKPQLLQEIQEILLSYEGCVLK